MYAPGVLLNSPDIDMHLYPDYPAYIYMYMYSCTLLQLYASLRIPLS
jgi:hypothetical protein